MQLRHHHSVGRLGAQQPAAHAHMSRTAEVALHSVYWCVGLRNSAGTCGRRVAAVHAASYNHSAKLSCVRHTHPDVEHGVLFGAGGVPCGVMCCMCVLLQARLSCTQLGKRSW